MDTEAFVAWALDDARTVEERYTTELLLELGMTRWKSRHKIHEPFNYDAIAERDRQRAFNPAYDPRYTEQTLRRCAEVFPDIKEWSQFCSHDERPIRDLQVLRFFPQLETVHLQHTEITDVSPLAELPRLRALHFSSFTCRDLRPIARCTGLHDLQLKLLKHWPDVQGLSDLPAVESLLLEGNLLVFERAVFPKVKFASLKCDPLEARNVRDLPQLPLCEFLSIGGIEMLDGIEAFPRLRNLILSTPAESFEPLTQLTALTCFIAQDHEPIDVTPLARVPGLRFLCFNTQHKLRVRPVKPRDLAPLVEAPALCELEIIGNPMLETEAAAIQAGLPSWGDLYLLPQPRPLPAWRLMAWPTDKIPYARENQRLPDEPEQIDIGLRARELRWANRYLRRAINKKLGTSDWGAPQFDLHDQQTFHPHIIHPTGRSLGIEFQSYGLLDKIPLAIEAIRECLARLRPDYQVCFTVRLTAPPPPPTKAQKKLQEKFDRERDEAEWERSHQERQDYLERLHRYELRKQAGGKVDPKEFAPGELAPLPEAPWNREDDDEDENDDPDGDGGVTLKEKPEPAASIYDDEHPLAGDYNLWAFLSLDKCYVYSHHAGMAEYLFQRGCDEVIEPEKKPRPR